MYYLFASELHNSEIFHAYPDKTQFDIPYRCKGVSCSSSLGKLARVSAYAKGGSIFTIEVDTDSSLLFAGDSIVLNKLKIVKRWTLEELFEQEDGDIHFYLLKYEVMHNLLCESPFDKVRMNLIQRTTNMDIIRKLARDPSLFIRLEVARRFGKECEDILIRDRSTDVHRELARQGLKLDQLFESSDVEILCHVIRHGFAIDRLWQHEDETVSSTALDYVLTNMDESGEYNCVYPAFSVPITFDKNDANAIKNLGLSVKNRRVMASHGVMPSLFLKDECPHVRIAARKYRNTLLDRVCIYFLEKRHGKKN